jgi:uncharacterized protein
LAPSDDLLHESLFKKYIEQTIQAQPSPRVLFTWHGGEPLLAGLDFYRQVIQYQKPYRNHYTIDNALQTNGMLLNDEWCRFLKDTDWLVGLSLDGPETVHSYYRKDYT